MLAYKAFSLRFTHVACINIHICPPKNLRSPICVYVPFSAQSFDFVELWAGEAVTSRVVRMAGRNTAALDIDYFEKDPSHPHRSNHFDIMTESGFLFLGHQ